MARNRQRARERKQRQRDNNDAPAPEPQQPEHVPDAFEHSSSSIDEVNAALGAGVPRDPVGGEFEIDEAEFEREKADIADEIEAPPPPKKPGLLPRTIAFLRACWAELQRVQWPDRRQVGQATAVVLGFVVVAGAFLGLADVVAQKIVDYIL